MPNTRSTSCSPGFRSSKPSSGIPGLPALTDLIRKHKELGQLQAELVAGKERGEAVGLDLKRLRVLRQAAGDHVGLDDYLDNLIQRALPHLSLAIEGKTLYDLIENQLRFTPVGIQPLRMEEGYLILTIGQSKGRSLRAYRFHKSRILRGGEAYLQLQLECVEERKASRYEPAESIKWSLIGRHRVCLGPRPSTLMWIGRFPYSTLLPIAEPAPPGAHAGMTVLNDRDLMADGPRSAHLEGDLVAC